MGISEPPEPVQVVFEGAGEDWIRWKVIEQTPKGSLPITEIRVRYLRMEQLDRAEFEEDKQQLWKLDARMLHEPTTPCIYTTPQHKPHNTSQYVCKKSLNSTPEWSTCKVTAVTKVHRM